MNKGLKKWVSQIPLTIGNIGEAKINLNKNDANLHILLPLINTVGLDPIKTNLVFNLQDFNEAELFGKGFKLNFYRKISENGTTLNVKNADGSLDSYLSKDNFLNKETGFKLEKKKEKIGYQVYYSYELTDNYKNLLTFDDSQPYPLTIEFSNGAEFKMDFVATTKYIKNYQGDEIRFTKNGNTYITKVEYYHNNNLISFSDLSYDSTGRLTRITYNSASSKLASATIIYGTNEIIVKDDNSGKRIKFNISGTKVVSFASGNDDSFENSKVINIYYQNGYSCVSNSKGRKSYFFFDSNDVPSFQMNDKGQILETEYDKETKVLKSNSGQISFNSLENLFNALDVSGFTKNGVTISKVNVNDTKFKSILSDSVYKVSGTGTLKKTISINGLATDNTLAVLFGKQLTPATENSYVEVTLSAGGYDVDRFEKTRIDSQFELITLGTIAEKSFSTIELEIKLVGNPEIEIGGIKVASKEFASFYNYDESGNPTLIGDGRKTTSMKYGSDNLPTESIGFDSVLFNYEYDDYGNLVKAKTAYGAQIINTYDTKNRHNLLSTKITNKDGTKILETSRTYSSDGRFLVSKTDELGNVTKYDEYDSLGKIKKITNALGVISQFIYNGDGTLNKLILQKDKESSFLNYEYNAKHKVDTVKAANGSNYKFVYDDRGNIIEIKLNDSTIYAYEYDPNNGRLIKQKFGTNSDAYCFEYDQNEQLSKVYYEDTKGIKALKFKYFYNVDGQLTRVEDGSGNLLEQFDFDQNGKLLQSKSNLKEVNNTYDNLGNVVIKSVNVDDFKIFSSYDSVNRSKGSHPGSIYEPFKKTYAYIGIFENDASLVHQSSNIALYPILNHKTVNKNFKVYRDGVIPYILVNSSNILSYQRDDKSYTGQYCDHISFWFKPTSSTQKTTKQYLFSRHSDDPNDKNFIGIYLKGNKVYLEIVDYKGVVHNLLSSNFNLDLNKWNFVSLNFMNRDDGPAYGPVCEFVLMVNGHKETYRSTTSLIYVDFYLYDLINIGHKYNGSSTSNYFDGKIACIMLGKNRFLENPTPDKFYRLTKDYIIDNEIVDSGVNAVDFSQTNVFTTDQSILDSFEIFPLQNNVVSLKGKRPTKFNVRNLSSYDKDRTFNFNARSKRYAFVADGEDLAYDFGFSDVGTIVLKAFTDVRETRQYLFEGRDSSGRTIGLYRDVNEYINVEINGTSITTTLKFETNKWQTVAFSFEENIKTGYSTTKYLDLRVMLDDQVWTSTKSISASFGKLEFYIGKASKKEKIDSSFGSYDTYYALNGQIEMLCSRPSFCEESTLKNLIKKLEGTIKTSKFDELGMLKKVDVFNDGMFIYSTTYAYKARSNNAKYLSKQINNEIIRFGRTLFARAYTFDKVGNLTNISDLVFGNHNYSYDYRGYLTYADGETFSYDSNGNITKKGNKVFSYDSVLKDRLAAVNGVSIEYDSSNPFNPIKYGNKKFSFEGKRLTKYENTSIKVEYLYNEQGLRTEKKFASGSRIKFVYDSNKLISEIGDAYRLDFLYDDSGLLYGFILDKDHKYFYLRDVFGNILGILDERKSLIVKYKYNAWGEITEIISDSDTDIGELNPFKFKGYYYDRESSMYYCKSRYYVPEWCRWLNADNPKYLDFNNVKSANLFAYCQNDPILGSDEEGKFWLCFFAAVLISGLVSAAVDAIFSIANGEEITVKSIVTSFIGGATGAALSFVPGLGNSPLSEFVVAAAESITGELFDYVTGAKELSFENALNSIKKIVSDTVVNGSISIISDEIFGIFGSKIDIDIDQGFKRSIIKSKTGSEFASGNMGYVTEAVSDEIISSGKEYALEKFIEGLSGIFPNKLSNSGGEPEVFN